MAGWVLTTCCKRSGLITTFPGQPGLLTQARPEAGVVDAASQMLVDVSKS